MNNLTEIFRPVKGYEGLYEISNLGRVKSLGRMVKSKMLKNGETGKRFQKERILRSAYFFTGYTHVALSKYNKPKTHSIHRLVVKAFIENPLNKPCVNHKNGTKDDNRLKNLEWCTYSENNIDSIKRSRTPVMS